jgi:hypothetical protein
MIPRLDIISLWHTSRIACESSATRYDRMIWVRNQLAPKYPELSAKTVWLEIEAAIS